MSHHNFVAFGQKYFSTLPDLAIKLSGTISFLELSVIDYLFLSINSHEIDGCVDEIQRKPCMIITYFDTILNVS